MLPENKDSDTLQTAIALYESHPNPTVILNRSLLVVWSNRSAQKTLPSLRLPEGFYMLMPEADREHLVQELEEKKIAVREYPRRPLWQGRMNFQLFPGDSPIIVCVMETFDQPTPSSYTGNAIPALTNSVRNAVFYIYSSAQMLERILQEKAITQGDDYVDVLYKKSYQILRTTLMLSSYYQYFDGNTRFNPMLTDLCEFLRSLCEAVSSVMFDSGITFSYQLHEKSLLTEFMPDKLAFSILYILRNAFMYSRKDGNKNQVSLSLTRDNQTAKIVIVDQGRGMSPEQVAQLFSSSEAASGEEGTPGLGLTIAKMTVEEHGGTLTVQSKEGAGTRVTIKLPVTTNIFDALPLNQNITNYDMDRFSPVYIVLADLASDLI